jgi:hypothetical protein
MMLFTCHVTPVLPPPPCTLAVNCWVWLGGTVAVVGEMEMEALPPPQAESRATRQSAPAAYSRFINVNTLLSTWVTA